MNASILDAIDRILFCIEHQKEIPHKLKTLEYCLEDVSAADVKYILLQNDINNCNFSDNSLFVTAPLSDTEISAEIEDLQSCAVYWIKRLIKWSDNSEDYKTQISQYLQKHSLKYAPVEYMLKNYTNN